MKQKPDTTEIVRNALRTLGVSAPAIRVYLDLLTRGETTPRLIAERLRMSRPSVYDQLTSLQALGLIGKRDIGHKTFVQVQNPRVLSKLIAEQKATLETQEKSLSEIAHALASFDTTEAPRILFYEGQKALQNALHATLWDTSSELIALWPYNTMLEALDKKFLADFNEKRIRHKVRMRTLWPEKKSAHVWIGRDDGITRRYLKKQQNLDMGYVVYGDSVLCISSRKESYGFVITSKNYADLMRFQFETLWSLSK